MSFRCPKCGAEYDAALFQFGVAVRCDCGEIVRPEHVRPVPDEVARREGDLQGSVPQGEGPEGPWRQEGDSEGMQRQKALRDEEAAYGKLQRAADRIAFLIVATDYPRIDIEIEQRNLKELCRRMFPDKLRLFDMIYAARFRRLWEQFRG